MKKTGLFKIIMFILPVLILLSWIFSASYFTDGELVELGMYQLGFFDYFQLLFASLEFQYFLQIYLCDYMEQELNVHNYLEQNSFVIHKLILQ